MPSPRARFSPLPCRIILLSALLALSAGCKSRCDLVEAELRTRENELYHLRGELGRATAHNDALHRENHALHQGVPHAIIAENASQVATVKEIVLGRGTGGYDDDNLPGDEALQVVVQPNDVDGHTIKAPGSLHIVAMEVNAEGFKRPLCSWDLSPDQLRKTWRSGLLSTGYFVLVPWRAWPTTPKLRIVVQFLLPDGRAFEADKDITVQVAPSANRPPLPPGPVEMVPVPAGPDVDAPLGPPRKPQPDPVMPPATARHEPAEPGDHVTAWRYRQPNGARLLPPVPVR